MSTPDYDFDSQVRLGLRQPFTLRDVRGVVVLWRGILQNPGSAVSAARSLAVERARITYKDIEPPHDPVTLECEHVGDSQPAVRLVTYTSVDRVNTARAFLVFLTELGLAATHDFLVAWRQGGESGESLYRVQKEEPRILWAPDGKVESLVPWQE